MRAPVPTCPASTSSRFGCDTGSRPATRYTGCLVTRNGTPESGTAAAPARLTGTPSRLESSVSAQPLWASASARIDARRTRERPLT